MPELGTVAEDGGEVAQPPVLLGHCYATYSISYLGCERELRMRAPDENPPENLRNLSTVDISIPTQALHCFKCDLDGLLNWRVDARKFHVNCPKRMVLVIRLNSESQK